MSEIPTMPLGGLLASAPEYGANAPALPWDGVRPRYLRITDIDDSGRLLSDDLRSIPVEFAEPYLLQPGDIVIARTGNTVGKSYMHREENGPVAFAGYLIKFRIDPAKANRFFVFQYLHSPSYLSWVDRTLRTGAQPNINASEYATLPLPCLNAAAQSQIAEILLTVDEEIMQTEALIAKYQQIKARLMCSLFTRGVTPDGRLRPSRAVAPHLYEQSTLGWIPKEWQVVSVADCAANTPGSTAIGPFGSNLITPDYRQEGVPVIFVRDVKENVFEWNSNVYVSEAKAHELAPH